MTAYLWAAVGLGVLAVAAYPVLTYLIDKPERPRWRAQGSHHRLRWWQRIRDERAQERAQDALNMRLIHDISEGIRRESTGPLTSSGMRRAEWPLQPLPPGAEEHADHFHRVPMPPDAGEYALPVMAAVPDGWTSEQWTRPDLWGPGLLGEPAWIGPPEAYVPAAEPQDVATPEQAADAYVGGYARKGAGEMVPRVNTVPPMEPEGLAGQPGENGSDAAGLIGPQPRRSLPSPAPEPEPSAVDTPLTDYREETGSWAAIRDDVLAGGE